ncbi:MAG TPA: IclR family transcriptional regulator [Actinomycetota bacterium]|nr:IclR family transcriptional regulator [Actinomycetota bacterium]
MGAPAAGDARRAAAGDARSLVPAVSRAAAILDELAGGEGGALGPSELARRLSLPKSSVVNICNALVDAGLARRRDGGFVLGGKLAELGAAYLSAFDLVREFHEACAAADPPVEETLQLAVLGDGLDVIYLARRDGSHRVRLASDVGRRLPATCTATGKALLASLPPGEAAARLPQDGGLATLTPNSIARVKALLEELERVRALGFAVDREETLEGVTCVGAAVPAVTPDGDRAAVSCTLLTPRAGDDRIVLLAQRVQALAGELADRVGTARQS